MALQRFSHTGAAPATGLTSSITAAATTFQILSGTGYPTGGSGPFTIAIDQGLPTEEHVLVATISGTTVTVQGGVAGRGYDNTTAASHNSGVTNVELIFTAAEADDDNAHVYTTGRDDHTQYLLASGARTNTGQTGATAASRYVGGTTSGAPASGTFVTGDYVVDQSGAMWVCTAGGTPGTWAKIGSGAALTYAQSFPTGAPTSLTINVPAALTSVSLVTGTWLLLGQVDILNTIGAANVDIWAGPNSASATAAYGGTSLQASPTTQPLSFVAIAVLGSTTTVYLNVEASSTGVEVQHTSSIVSVPGGSGIIAVKIV